MNEAIMIDLTPIINALILLAATIICAVLIPWIKSKHTAQETANLEKWAGIAAAAAQQVYYQADGAKRLEYALSILKEKGFKVDTLAVINAVEAAVLKLHNALSDEEGSE